MVNLKVFRSLWGCGLQKNTGCKSQPRWTELISRLRAIGYAGIECSLLDCGDDDEERMHFREALDLHGLDLIISCYSSWVDYEGPSPQTPANIKSELQVFSEELEKAKKLAPIKINAHVGSDLWPNFEDHEALFAGCLQVAEGFPNICFETHRGRPLGHPTNALRLLSKFPQLTLTGDFSHWSIAVERPLREISTALKVAIPRCQHIHARVGTIQSPQLHDAQGDNLDDYKRVWAQIWRSAVARDPHVTLTANPEYGPPPYAPLHSSKIEIDRVNDLGKSTLESLFTELFPD